MTMWTSPRGPGVLVIEPMGNVDGPDRLGDAVDAAQRYPHAQPHGLRLDPRVLLQEYVPGEEYSCDTVVASGVAYPLPVVGKDTTEGRYRVETGHTCPSGLPAPPAAKARHTAARAALAVGVRNGIAHTEVKIPPGTRTPHVIETGARLPGDSPCEVVEAATGVSEATAHLQAVLGLVPDTAPHRTDAAAIRFLLPEHGGVLRRADVPGLPGRHSELCLRPGDAGARADRLDVPDRARRGPGGDRRPGTAPADRAIARSRVEVG
ncbi:ATP-grasp domain-containing protein [Streptomyces coelicoflavus]|uniref:ATP-grasp domain-containing protein n=1 Tax=Streptomyces coelicoflavus TaxID=285562 RepID=A0A7K3PF64_9ACTN|nr:ATP-grasp domain-containing protein [Streptomyces coelicoflavus]NEB08646.1 ATP-grasp domain-containing protein [Streptomyces coelicoflavus]